MATGSVVGHHQLVLPPDQASAVVELNDLTGYGHNFSLHFVLPDDNLALMTMNTFEFGTAIPQYCLK